MAEFGWVYFSKEQKEVAGTIIKMMSQSGMVDELGIGAIRDSFANYVFPGISTVQTRAKYFFIVPYIIYDYQKLLLFKNSNKSATKYLYEVEQNLKRQLSEKYKDVDNAQIIGMRLPLNQPIVRRPSSIYWTGIGAYKLINTKGLGVDSFLESVTTKKKIDVFSEITYSDDGFGDDVDLNFDNKFKLHASINPIENWKDELEIELTKDEADILNNVITKHQPNSLLAFILQSKEAQKLLNTCDSFAQFANASSQLKLPIELYNNIKLAHDFSEIMYGSNLAYNYLLHKERNYKSNRFIEDWNSWKKELQNTLLNKENNIIENVLTSDFAKTTKERTKYFLANWWELINTNSPIEQTEEIIWQQELFNKKAKARLQYQRWDDVIEGKSLGLQQLNYRFTQAKRIINDILNAKEK